MVESVHNSLTLDTIVQGMRHMTAAAFWSESGTSPQWFRSALESASGQIGDIDRLKRFRSEIDSAYAKTDSPIEVFVVGLGKHGKSTLVNALLGMKIAEVDFLPKTWCFHRYIAVDEPATDVHLYVQLPLTESQAHLRGRLGQETGEKQGLLHKFLCPQTEATEILKNEESMCGPGKSYSSPIMEVEFRVHAPNALFRNLRLVDTHGLEQILVDGASRMHMDWEYQRADAVIWVVMATKLEASAIMREVTHFRRYAKCVVLALTGMDAISQKEKIFNTATEMYASQVNCIIPVVGTAGFQAVSTGDSELMRRSGIIALQSAIDKHILQKGEMLRSRQQYCALRQIQREYRLAITTRIDELEENLRKYNQVIQSTREVYNSSTEEAKRLLDGEARSVKAGMATRCSGIELGDSEDEVRTKLQINSVTAGLQKLSHDVESRMLDKYRRHLSSLMHISYKDSFFGSTGIVAEQKAVGSVSTENLPPIVPYINFQIEGGLPRIITKIVFNWLTRKIPYVEEQYQRLSKERRDRTLDMVQERVESHCTNLRDRWLSKLADMDKAVSGDIQRNIDKAGGVKFMQDETVKLSHRLPEYVVPSFFYHLTLKTMRKLGWPRSC